jgi:type IV pilus assembly protein PilM
MTIFQKGVPVAQRSIQTGGLTFGKLIAENMNVSIAEAMEILPTKKILQSNEADKKTAREALLAAVDELVKECRRTGDYYILNKKDATFTHLVLVGSGAALLGMQEIMDEQLDVKVERFDVLKMVTFDSRFEKNKVQANAASLGVAIGAAMAGGVEDD